MNGETLNPVTENLFALIRALKSLGVSSDMAASIASKIIRFQPWRNPIRSDHAGSRNHPGNPETPRALGQAEAGRLMLTDRVVEVDGGRADEHP